SPLLAVARFIVDIQPPGAKDFVVGIFGTADKLAFQALIVLVGLAIGAGLGRLAPARPAMAATILALFAAPGFAAPLRAPGGGAPLSAASAGIEAGAGIWLPRRLVAAAAPAPPTGTAAMPDWARRSLLRTGGAIAVGSVAVGAVGRLLLERR